MKKFKEKYPIVLSAIVVAIAYVCIMACGIFNTTHFLGAFIYEAVSMILAFLATTPFVEPGTVYKAKGFWKSLSIAGYMTVMEFFLLAIMSAEAVLNPETVWAEPVVIVYGIVMLFGIGFREESLFRGLTVNLIGRKYIKNEKGIFITAWASAVMFGAIHMVNMISGVDFISALIQSVTAAGVGFYMAAVYLRGGNLWALILLHAVTDAASLFGAAFTENNGNVIESINTLTWVNLIPFFIFSAVGLFLLRKEKRSDIAERFAREEIEI